MHDDECCDPLPFRVSRFISEGMRIDRAVKVSALKFKALDVANLRTVESMSPKETLTSSIECRLHQVCRGHLRLGRGGGVGLPSYCSSNEDPDTMSEVDKINRSILGPAPNLLQSAVEMRNAISGKRGQIRYKCMGFSAVTSCRGVASCSWHADPRAVFLPARWMKRIKVPTRTADVSSGLLSPYISARAPVDGDFAILTRSPVMSEESVQSVRVYSWNKLSVGVHAEMCKPLNLDFDGDEVHVSIVDGEVETRELAKYAETHQLCRFSRIIEDTARRDGPSSAASDFMLPTTLSITQLRKVRPVDHLFELSNCRLSSWNQLISRFSQAVTSRESFTSSSVEAVHQFSKSHIEVSEGYTFGRQLKHAAMLTTLSGSRVRTTFAADQAGHSMSTLVTASIAREPGYPGVRLAANFSARVMQDMLDRAKHKKSCTSSDIMLDMLGKTDGRAIIRRLDGSNVIVRLPYLLRHGELFVCTTSRAGWNVADDPAGTFRACLVLSSLGCKLAGVMTSPVQLIEYAHMIHSSALSSSDKIIADLRTCYFLSSTDCHRLVAACCDDTYALDKADTHEVGKSKPAHVDVSVAQIAVITGNYSLQLPRSCVEF